MDPYTEARHLWKGLHTQLIGELSTHQLPPLLAPAYFVDAEPSLQVYQPERDVYPHVQVVAIQAPVATIMVEPAADEEDEESAIYIREAGSERLVTVIEILSYSNKTAGSEKRGR
jgi:hypothetical protein